MGDGSNSINYHRVGVIRENPMRCIYTADDQGEIFIVSSSEFENRTDLKDGDCCVVDFKTNFSEELGNGVYNAEIYKYDSVAVWPLHETLTDTTVVLDKERLVTLDFKKSIYLEGRFFLQTQHVNHQVDQKDILKFITFCPSLLSIALAWSKNLSIVKAVVFTPFVESPVPPSWVTRRYRL